MLWPTSGSRTDQQVWRARKVCLRNLVHHRRPLPREVRSGLREKEMTWVGRAQGDGTKEVRLWVEPLGQLSPNILDSDSSYVGNSMDYLGDLIVLCPNI